MNCINCAKQYLCEDFNKKEDCERFMRFLNTKNYGEVKHIKEKT